MGSMENKNLISEEQKKLQKDMEIVMATEGFSLLTKKQQQILKQSLYIQARAERKTEEERYADNHKYKDSQKYVADRNCHNAIIDLEKEKSLQDLPVSAKIEPNFFEAKYVSVKTVDELKKQIEKFGFPCVLHVSSSNKNSDSTTKAHSSLVLGHDNKDNIIVWEKKSFGIPWPYQIITLDQVYNTYGNNYYYGLRKLRSDIKI